MKEQSFRLIVLIDHTQGFSSEEDVVDTFLLDGVVVPVPIRIAVCRPMREVIDLTKQSAII